MISNLRVKCIAILVLTAAIGCSGQSHPKLHDVRGAATFQRKPAAKAVVVLRPVSQDAAGKLLPHGEVQADGTFRIGTFADGDGAPAGEYRVTITWPESRAEPDGVEIASGDRLKGRFNDPAKSKWTIQVREGSNVLEPFILD